LLLEKGKGGWRDVKKTMNEMKLTGKLVGAQELLNELFSDGCRPSLRWLRSQTAAKSIPYVRIGHLVFFDVEMVRAHVAGTRLLRARCLLRYPTNGSLPA
jgi:hypothetical protein